MTATGPSTHHPNADSSPVYRAVESLNRRRFNAFQHQANTVILRWAGSRLLRMYGVVQHHGRRSGRSYATPVIMRPTADGFVMPLLAGERADWLQNLRAAGGGMVRWNGRTYPVTDPVVIDWTTARPWFGRLMRVYITTLLRSRRFVRVRHAAALT